MNGVTLQPVISLTFQYLRKEIGVVFIIERWITAQEDAANDSITKLVVAKTKAAPSLPLVNAEICII
jgi:hypothetical protein